ncbi:hypothetical protein Tco_0973234 [Tanacetum coccineum]
MPPYNNQQSFYQSPSGLYRPTMDSSTSSQANQPYSPLNRVTLDMNFEQLMYSQEYYAGQGSGHGNQDNYPSRYYSMGHGSALVDDDDSPIEEMSLVKAKNPSKRASKANKDNTKEPPKEWITTKEVAFCKGWCDVSENCEKENGMKTKEFWDAVINYFTNETGSTRGGECDLTVYQKACQEYKLIYGRDFTLEPCQNILKDYQAWLEVEIPSFNKNTKGQKKSKTSKTTSGSAPGGFNLNNEVDESEEETREH